MDASQFQTLSSAPLADAVALLERMEGELWYADDDDDRHDLLAKTYETLIGRTDMPEDIVPVAARMFAEEKPWFGGVLATAACLRSFRGGERPGPALLDLARPVCKANGDGSTHGRELLATMTEAAAKELIIKTTTELDQAPPYLTLFPLDLAFVASVMKNGSSAGAATFREASLLPSTMWTELLASLTATPEPNAYHVDRLRTALAFSLAREKGDAVTPDDLFGLYDDQLLYPEVYRSVLTDYVRDASSPEWVAWLSRKPSPEIEQFNYTLFLEVGARIAPRAFATAAGSLLKSADVVKHLAKIRPTDFLVRALVAQKPDASGIAFAKKIASRSLFPKIVRDYDTAAPSDPSLLGLYLLGKAAKKTVPFTALSTQATPDPRGFQPCERSRIGGPGPMLGDLMGPNGAPMVHVATLFADEVPGLALPEDVAALAFYISDPMEHEADDVGNDHALVRMIDAKTAAKMAAASERDLPVQRLLTATIPIPAKVDADDWTDATEALDGYAGGAATWVQGPVTGKKWGRFLFQGNDELLPINLGDGGTFYVFEKTAFFQCS